MSFLDRCFPPCDEFAQKMQEYRAKRARQSALDTECHKHTLTLTGLITANTNGTYTVRTDQGPVYVHAMHSKIARLGQRVEVQLENRCGEPKFWFVSKVLDPVQPTLRYGDRVRHEPTGHEGIVVPRPAGQPQERRVLGKVRPITYWLDLTTRDVWGSARANLDKLD